MDKKINVSIFSELSEKMLKAFENAEMKRSLGLKTDAQRAEYADAISYALGLATAVSLEANGLSADALALLKIEGLLMPPANNKALMAGLAALTGAAPATTAPAAASSDDFFSLTTPKKPVKPNNSN